MLGSRFGRRALNSPVLHLVQRCFLLFDIRVALTVGIARRWGWLAAQLGNKQLDLAIAATALEHGLFVVTRNVSDFESQEFQF